MRKHEERYEFKKKLIEIHKRDLRNYELLPNENEIEITHGYPVDISSADSEVVLTAARDFADYMLISMNVSVLLCRDKISERCIRVVINPDDETLDTAKGYMGYRLTVSDTGIDITAYDERGAAQAFYRLEDLMTIRKAPYLEKGTIQNRAMFSPRMIQTGYGEDEFPDCHLRDIAHAGMDAIMLNVRDVNKTHNGFVDFNEIIYRAAKYGIDVYCYSHFKSPFHPDDAGAEAYYDSTYGELFKHCPGFKGVILVGESVAIPSHDPHTSGSTSRVGKDGIPSTKPHPGWWPCEDYPDWLRLLRKVIDKHKKNVDIVLWSYNWGWAPTEDRVRLIETLPKDVSLLVTYEMHEAYEVNGVKEYSADYTLSLAGPGHYFVSEAEAAKKAGIRLYAMSNTGGLTWDFGSVPYEPFPMQWQKRYDSLRECSDKYGLCGLMESHHYGFYPSFISELAKWNFTVSDCPDKEILSKLLDGFFTPSDTSKLMEALKLWSQAICFYDATSPDQYGAFRIGPSYPLIFIRRLAPIVADYAEAKSGNLEPVYNPFTWYERGLSSIPQLTIHSEIKRLGQMEMLMQEGIELIEGLNDRSDALDELLDLGKYMRLTIITVINSKKFLLAKTRLNGAEGPEAMKKALDDMEEIALGEIENAKAAIPLVRANSRLGWEPSMEYLGDEEHINRKIRQVEFMIEVEIGDFRKGLKHNL